MRKAAEDYAPFNAVWNKPDGGLHAYLVRFLSSADITFQHIAVWVCVPAHVFIWPHTNP